MQLIDELSAEELELIEDYILKSLKIKTHAATILRIWNERKRTLYKALGRKLRCKVPIKVEKNELVYMQGLQKIYRPIAGGVFSANHYEDLVHYWNKYLMEHSNYIRNDFVVDMYNWVASHLPQHFKAFIKLMRYKNFYAGTINADDFLTPYKIEELNITIKCGMRTMKVIQKILNKTNYPHMDKFEVFRNQISDLNSNKYIEDNLVLSIHPLDILSLSDNTIGWSSCLSLLKNNSFSSGCFDVLNSNCVVVAYLESNDKQFYEGKIPNKYWRSLMVVHKDIICAGKGYPFINEELSKEALRQMATLVKQNLNWDYTIKEQDYGDLRCYYEDDYELCQYGVKLFENNFQRKICFITKNLYNDFLNDRTTTYWCYRNKPKKSLVLNLSGPCICLCCGKQVDSQHYDPHYKMCTDCCDNHVCYKCGTYHTDELIEVKYLFPHIYESKKKYCKKCLESKYYRLTNVGKEDIYFSKAYCSDAMIDLIKKIAAEIYGAELIPPTGEEI